MSFHSNLYKIIHRTYTFKVQISTNIIIMNSKQWTLQSPEADMQIYNPYDQQVQSQIKQDDQWAESWNLHKKQDLHPYFQIDSNRTTKYNNQNKLSYSEGQDEIDQLYPEKQQIYQQSINYQSNQKQFNIGQIQLQGTSLQDYANQIYNQTIQQPKQQQKVIHKKSKIIKNPRNQTYELDQKKLQADTKTKLVNKVKQIFDKRNQQQNHIIQKEKTLQTKNKNRSNNKIHIRKKRVAITRQIIEKLKVNFQHYVSSIGQPYKQRMTFRQISERIGISMTQVKHLYDQYNKDPLFMSRMSRFNQGSPLTRITTQFRTSNAHNHILTQRRLHFMSQLIKRNGYLTQKQIANQMSKVDSLHQIDNNGQKIPISRKIIQHLMKVAQVQSKGSPIYVLNINTPEAINNRFRYASRYLELTQQPNADIYFMGQFSFANNQSLSSCPPLRRQNFCQTKPKKNDKSDNLSAKSQSEPQKYHKSLQYILIMSLQGIVYYELFNNMFEQINFAKTVVQIGKSISDRNPKMKKYLVLQTSFLHRRDDLLNLQQTYNVKILFLPPQTPMLNPTQYLFSEIKTVTRSKAYKHKKSIPTILVEVLQMMKDKAMNCYYSCIRPYIKLALSKEPFK